MPAIKLKHTLQTLATRHIGYRFLVCEFRSCVILEEVKEELLDLKRADTAFPFTVRVQMLLIEDTDSSAPSQYTPVTYVPIAFPASESASLCSFLLPFSLTLLMLLRTSISQSPDGDSCGSSSQGPSVPNRIAQESKISWTRHRKGSKGKGVHLLKMERKCAEE